MRRFIKGFGKRYFKLSSIVAYSTAIKLNSQEVAFSFLKFGKKVINAEINDEEEDPPNDIFLTNTKICNCAKAYYHKARLTLLLNHFIPRCPYYTTWYAFRRTGVHPPLNFLIILYKTKT
ncbi:MAG: hypothetical protein PHI79_03875 [Sulfurovaceae bacterium]|nr:hypothetical protein [Sulfurovaceae bacterium]MDD5548721.1 hypothetical protein [Sulfurovaceae bacterium]